MYDENDKKRKGKNKNKKLSFFLYKLIEINDSMCVWRILSMKMKSGIHWRKTTKKCEKCKKWRELLEECDSKI